MEYLLIIFFLGVLTPIQTAANSRLRLSVGSPLVASWVQFVIGSVFLAVATQIERGNLFFPTSLFRDLPLWAWLGGLCGVYALTVNIIIFPKLGSMQTVLMPMLGQISMGLLIDHFGMLRSQVHTFGLLRAMSLVIIFTGLIMVVLRRGEKNHAKQGTLIWQIVGFSGGAIYAMQPPMNGLLAGSLSSSVYAALITFLTATFLLTITVLITRSDRIHLPQIFSLSCPWWAWLGGIIGGTFVTGFAFFADKVSIGVLLVTSICGMLTISLFIDKNGWLGAAKRKIGIRQYAGLLLIAAGVALLRLN